MTIAVEISGPDDFYFHCFNTIAIQHPEIKVVFLIKKNIQFKKDPADNIEYITLSHNWYNTFTESLFLYSESYRFLKKIKASIYFSSTASLFISKRIKTVLYVDQISSVGKNIELLNNSFLLIAANDLVKNLLTERLASLIEKTKVIPYGSLHQNKLDESEKTALKNTLTSGKEFFLLDGKNCKEHDITIVLKSFSHFKKWQQSGFKIIITVSEKQEASILNLIKNYKYREDVVVLIDEKKSFSELALLSSAYTAIFISKTDLSQQKILTCFVLKTPVVMADDNYLRSSFNENVLFFKENELAEKMILLYKNEHLRDELIHKAARFAETISWKIIAEKIWDEIIENSQK